MIADRGRTARGALVHRAAEGFSRAEAIGLALALAVTGVFLGVLVVDTGLAARLVVEDGPVEWAQVPLFLVAGLLRAKSAFRCAAERRPAAPDVLLAFGFAVLVIGEVDLDKVLFG
ncbi:MAG TPA: hypothetical protein VML54_04695, partial [Candidatus Limnocylindrales bacterium]|nr:hypothetical protein [Candidatus Limnocylindrales bacterium]